MGREGACEPGAEPLSVSEGGVSRVWQARSLLVHLKSEWESGGRGGQGEAGPFKWSVIWVTGAASYSGQCVYSKWVPLKWIHGPQKAQCQACTLRGGHQET